jgi:hypothetical protein
MTDGSHIPQEDLILYAMQSLPAEEAAVVRLHVAECAPCRGELAEISGDLALVAMSVEQHPLPEGARQRFIDRISAESAANPVTPQPVPTPPAVVSIDTGRHTRPSMTWIPWTLAAALVLIAVGLGVKVHLLNEEIQRESARVAEQTSASVHAQEVLNLLTAPKAQHVLLTAANAHPTPSAHAVYLPSRGALILQASNLNPLPENKTYELWVIPANGTAPVPAGLFRPDRQGSASVVLPQLPGGLVAKAFGVTVENAGGSGTPTLPIVLSGAAPAAGD